MLSLKCTPLLINRYGKVIVYHSFHRVADKNEYPVHSFPIVALQINHHKHRNTHLVRDSFMGLKFRYGLAGTFVQGLNS